MTVLIIEDEIRSALELERLLRKLSTGLEAIFIVHSVAEAVTWLRLNPPPHLILSDIQLSDGLSFEIFREIPLRSPVVFCTAYDEYALQAFDANGIDYLLKPLEEQKLEKSLQKWKLWKEIFGTRQESDLSSRFDSLLRDVNADQQGRLLAYSGNRIIPLKASEIDYIYTAYTLVYAHTAGKDLELRQTMEAISQVLDPDLFFRANRQYILNKRAVLAIEPLFTRKLRVILRGDKKTAVTVSKAKGTEFLNWMKA